MKHITKSMAFVTALAASSAANALYIDAVPNVNSPGDTSEQTVPDDNDYATRNRGVWTADAPLYSAGLPNVAGDGDPVLFGHNLVSNTTDPFRLTFTLLGYEASDLNQFLYGGTSVFQTKGQTAVDSTFSVVNYGTGLLDFSFLNQPETLVKNDADNGSQVNSTDSKFIDPVTGLNRTTTNFNLFEVEEDYWLISFDDGWTGDDNHDDMVIAVRASKVPEPGTLALLGLGLAGIALRFKAKK